jgi:hypothetical protein
MRLLALIMARNAGAEFSRFLDRIAQYCDGAMLVDDRSSDETAALGRSHPIVRTVYSVPAGESSGDWAISEHVLLNQLYSMAEGDGSDWVVRLDCDEHIEPAAELRSALEILPLDVVGARFPKQSTWNDPEYPDMVPLLGTARSKQGAAWRNLPGLRAYQELHNPRMPEGVADSGRIVELESPMFFHTGWSTLDRRISRARFYLSRDPDSRWNRGLPYDRGLLFGYSLQEIDILLGEYHRRRLDSTAEGSE